MVWLANPGAVAVSPASLNAHAVGAGAAVEVGELAPQQLAFLSDSAGAFLHSPLSDKSPQSVYTSTARFCDGHLTSSCRVNI